MQYTRLSQNLFVPAVQLHLQALERAASGPAGGTGRQPGGNSVRVGAREVYQEFQYGRDTSRPQYLRPAQRRRRRRRPFRRAVKLAGWIDEGGGGIEWCQQ